MTIYQIDENVEFEIVDGVIGASVSGGADSALMLYFVLKYTRQPVHIFTYVHENKMLRNPIASISVINKCADLTGNYDFTHHLIYRKYGNRSELFELPIKYKTQGLIDTLYTGITKNPPLQVSNNFMFPNTEHDNRDPTMVRPNNSEYVYMPWTNLDKQDLAKIYKQHNLMDTLFPTTRSCEWTPGSHGIPDPGMEHCGKCWWCQERQWGFDL
jgi:hypothetical protein